MESPPRLSNRRALSRALTRASRASVADCLAAVASSPHDPATRIGITGPPGAGKSTLIARLAATRLEARARMAVLAIDPTSPISRGSILGDRIRMDTVAEHPGLYIRSIPSRNAHDGLADNICEMLMVLDKHGFDEVILETVGVGQADYEIRNLVDTVVLVLVPESGDAVQAMKAGILETADIYVVNKCDCAGAEQMLHDIRSVVDYRHVEPGEWRPPVLSASITDDSIAELDEAINAHSLWRDDHNDADLHRRARLRYHVESLMSRRVAELFDEARSDLLQRPIREVYAELARKLGEVL
ncbi:MAG: GTP-binding protein [Pseudomonadales bacterium]|nr:GTP-binding protein [Pseudomonadales bacterium]MDP6470256.1 GTP-binding protein [Pseudomonadales bacterium]MDP6827162.1 GTP-binding protein [Pseudomonadales bacterium]MDP6971746.1 GTP-binding protein [Pseudomonadales bacterium]